MGLRRSGGAADCGLNVDLATGEMARPYCLTNDDPFSNLQPLIYWSGTEYAPNTSNAWSFLFNVGSQNYGTKTNALYAWAVRPGSRLT